MLLGKLPYAKSSPDNGRSALQAIMGSQLSVLQVDSSHTLPHILPYQILFSDLMAHILVKLVFIRIRQPFNKSRGIMTSSRHLVLNGWNLMDIALDEKTRRETVQAEKKERRLEQWIENHPLALTLFGRNLEPNISAILVDIEGGDIKTNEAWNHETDLNRSNSQSPDVSARAAESQRVTASAVSQGYIEPSTQISRVPELVKGNSDDTGVVSYGASSITSGRASPDFSTVTDAIS